MLALPFCAVVVGLDFLLVAKVQPSLSGSSWGEVQRAGVAAAITRAPTSGAVSIYAIGLEISYKGWEHVGSEEVGWGCAEG